MLGYCFSKLFKILNVPAVKGSKVDKTTWLGSGAQVVNSIVEGYSYMGDNVQCLYADIGKFCSIANNCIIGGAEHPINYVSTSPSFYGGYRKPLGLKTIKCGDLEWESYNKRTKIENDVWIGNNVIIKAGVIIGTGAIIGAGAVVTKSVPPYEIWGGNPAKLIRPRFSEELKQRLLNSHWWDLPLQDLIKLSEFMDEPESFLEEIKKYHL